MAVINYFALYSEAGSLPRLKLRTAYAFFAPWDFARPAAPLVGKMPIEPYKGGSSLEENPLTKQRQAAVCLSAQHELRPLGLNLVRM